jgi:type IV secretory pathway protease TraF
VARPAPRPGRRRRLVLAGSSAALAAAVAWHAPALGLCPPLLLRNTGPSMPLGLYVYDHAPPARRGEVVVLRRPPAFRHPWLMKRVEGVAGDLYCWRPELGTHELAGRPMPPPSELARALGVPVWRGCRRLAPGEVVGYGRGPSYDGRHTGPVREADLWGIYRPLVSALPRRSGSDREEIGRKPDRSQP